MTADTTWLTCAQWSAATESIPPEHKTTTFMDSSRQTPPQSAKANLPPGHLAAPAPRISRFRPRPLRRFLGGLVNETPPYTLIDQPAQLAPLLAALDRVDEVALDTEADNMFHYRTRVCLLQFLVAGEVFLVDLMTPLPLEQLWKSLATKHLNMHVRVCGTTGRAPSRERQR